MPDAIARGSAVFRPVSERPAPVRFVDGTSRFERYVSSAGEDPVRMAADLRALWRFLASRTDVVDSADLTESAARFAGNVVAVLHPAATWRVTSEPEIGTPARSIPVVRLVRTMVERPELLDGFLDQLGSWEQEDHDDLELRALSRQRPDRPLALPRRPFVRPPFPGRTFTDDSGRAIDYGDRWPDHQAPEEAYSRVSNPDRFAPLLLDLDALTGYLRSSYRVHVDRQHDADGAVRLRFRPTTGACITVTATVESVRIEAGALFSQVVPDCSCDACDETADSEATRLEAALLGIAAGGLRELYPVGRRRWLHTRLVGPDGTAAGSSGAPDSHLTRRRLHDAEQTVQRLDHGWWPAWTLRIADPAPDGAVQAAGE